MPGKPSSPQSQQPGSKRRTSCSQLQRGEQERAHVAGTLTHQHPPGRAPGRPSVTTAPGPPPPPRSPGAHGTPPFTPSPAHSCSPAPNNSSQGTFLAALPSSLLSPESQHSPFPSLPLQGTRAGGGQVGGGWPRQCVLSSAGNDRKPRRPSHQPLELPVPQMCHCCGTLSKPPAQLLLSVQGTKPWDTSLNHPRDPLGTGNEL